MWEDMDQFLHKEDDGKTFIKETDLQMKQLELAEVVAVIRALAYVIKYSEADAIAELQIELKSALDCLKASGFCL
ncbi:hypothetical protein QVD17_14926 [Tagetes erecta]|uniref:Uncharacterized protein n=1 Tax=Tagetes erecta TaxID=13708 RepID=A0AAD8NZ83_TARER|nr:hypothetical protein QVD17_14926 [Tagetes erecta]